MWPGKLVLKGGASQSDAEIAFRCGLDGIIVSNHGDRQLDAGPSSICSLRNIAKKFRGRIKVMMDSGIRSVPGIARTIASVGEFTFMGRAPMYGVAAVGAEGGNQPISIMKRQLQQAKEQLCCHQVDDLHEHSIGE